MANCHHRALLGWLAIQSESEHPADQLSKGEPAALWRYIQAWRRPRPLGRPGPPVTSRRQNVRVTLGQKCRSFEPSVACLALLKTVARRNSSRTV